MGREFTASNWFENASPIRVAPIVRARVAVVTRNGFVRASPIGGRAFVLRTHVVIIAHYGLTAHAVLSSKEDEKLFTEGKEQYKKERRKA
jgi:hypothetical protein